jgi:nucleotide-binding universal stress UspA family protein
LYAGSQTNLEMQRKNRILSLIDFSEHSETILRLTRSFGTYLQAEIVLIHQLPGIVTSRASASVREQVYKAEREDAFERLAELAGPLFETTPAMIASHQELTETLHSLKNDTYFDWLFIGMKGTSLLEQIFLGSKAVEVLDNTDYVTVTVPLTREFYFPQELVVALHAEYPFNSARLKTMLAQLSGVINKISFLTVTTDDSKRAENESLLSRLVTEFADLHPATVVIENGNVLKEVQRYMQDKQHCFLVVQEVDPSLHDFVFHRGLIKELVYKSLVPMIVLPYLPTEEWENSTAAG